MKIPIRFCHPITFLAVTFSLSLHAQSSSITYQGRLDEGGNPAGGSFDFRFRLATDPAGNNYVGGPVFTNAVTVAGGLFLVTIDFGAVFGGSNYWLEVDVKTNGAASYSALTPLQALTPTPYALFATTASNVSGTVSAAQLSGTISSVSISGTYANPVTLNNANNVLSGAFSGNGADVTNVNAATLNGISSAGFWRTNGNVGANPANGAFIGTMDNQPLEFKVWSERVLRLEVSGNSPNVIAGHRRNVVSNSFIGATIAGGGSSDLPNRVGNDFGAVLGGEGNLAQGRAATAMGYNSTARGAYSLAAGVDTLAGGISALALGNTATASGDYSAALGQSTTASGEYSTALGWGTTASALGATALGVATEASGERSIAAGFVTAASGFCATAFGRGSIAAGDYSLAAGYSARASHPGSFVWADSIGGAFNSTGWDQFLIRASGGVGLGTPNPQGSLHVYSAKNPTVVRVQSTGTPGFGRIEFVSNPQGDINEWRPGYIQSTDNGGFVGGLAFFVNGAGAGSKFGSNEVMRVVNGAVGIGTTTPVSALQVVGTVTATAFNPPSDRNLKENFAPVSPREVLEKVAALPISRWNFKEDAATPHVGPMAQDFHAAFGVGTDERHIATVDADGVALAAIQGLNEKLEAENAELKARLEKLEQLLNYKPNGGDQ